MFHLLPSNLLGMCWVGSQRVLIVAQIYKTFSSHKTSRGRQTWAGNVAHHHSSRIQSPDFCFRSLSMKPSSWLISGFPGTMSRRQRVSVSLSFLKRNFHFHLGRSGSHTVSLQGSLERQSFFFFSFHRLYKRRARGEGEGFAGG